MHLLGKQIDWWLLKKASPSMVLVLKYGSLSLSLSLYTHTKDFFIWSSSDTYMSSLQHVCCRRKFRVSWCSSWEDCWSWCTHALCCQPWEIGCSTGPATFFFLFDTCYGLNFHNYRSCACLPAFLVTSIYFLSHNWLVGAYLQSSVFCILFLGHMHVFLLH